jgi:hypothetical protein
MHDTFRFLISFDLRLGQVAHETRNNLATVTDSRKLCNCCGHHEGGGGAECHTENQLGHFREFRGVILHEFSTKIYDSFALCPVPIGRNPSKM